MYVCIAHSDFPSWDRFFKWHLPNKMWPYRKKLGQEYITNTHIKWTNITHHFDIWLLCIVICYYLLCVQSSFHFRSSMRNERQWNLPIRRAHVTQITANEESEDRKVRKVRKVRINGDVCHWWILAVNTFVCIWKTLTFWTKAKWDLRIIFGATQLNIIFWKKSLYRLKYWKIIIIRFTSIHRC